MAIKFYDSPFHVTHDEVTASKMATKMDLSILLGRLFKQQGWTQEKTAEILGLSQSRVSDLVNGKIEKFTLDAMFDMLDKIGFRTSFVFPKTEKSDEAYISIKRVAACAG